MNQISNGYSALRNKKIDFTMYRLENYVIHLLFQPQSLALPNKIYFQMRFIFMFLDFDMVEGEISPRNLYFYKNSFILKFRHSP